MLLNAAPVGISPGTVAQGRAASPERAAGAPFPAAPVAAAPVPRAMPTRLAPTHLAPTPFAPSPLVPPALAPPIFASPNAASPAAPPPAVAPAATPGPTALGAPMGVDQTRGTPNQAVPIQAVPTQAVPPAVAPDPNAPPAAAAPAGGPAAPAPAAAEPAPTTIAEQRRHLRVLVNNTRLGLEKSRVFRDNSCSGKFGETASAQDDKLQRHMASPHLWVDSKVKGSFSPFAVTELAVLEHGSAAGAARFREAAHVRAISVSSTASVKGMTFQLSMPGTTVNLSFAYENVVAACFGKAFGSGHMNKDNVVIVTLLLVHATKFQVVSFRIRSKDKTHCKKIINQKDGVGKIFLESKYVKGDTLSERTRALLSVFHGAGDDASHATTDLAERFGPGWESLSPSEFLAWSRGLGRIAEAVAADREDGARADAPSLAELMRSASAELRLGGLLTVEGTAPQAATAQRAPSREINCWPEQWEVDLQGDPGDDAKRRFESKYLGLVIRDDAETGACADDFFEGRIEKMAFNDGVWMALAREDGKSTDERFLVGSLPALAKNAWCTRANGCSSHRSRRGSSAIEGGDADLHAE